LNSSFYLAADELRRSTKIFPYGKPDQHTNHKKMKHTLKSVRTLAATLITFGSLAGGANAAVVSFNVSQTFTQGTGQSDLAATTVSIGSAGSFVVDPGSSGEYLDFDFTVGGAFASTGISPAGYPWMRSFDAGETITVSLDFNTSNWTTILDGGVTTSPWDSSHNGFIGFRANGGELGYISYDFSRSSGLSTITLNEGAFESIAGQSISIIPEPSSAFLLGLGALAVLVRRRRN
jgi:hypothetical protein